MKYHHLGLHFEEFQLKISKFRIRNSFSEIGFQAQRANQAYIYEI